MGPYWESRMKAFQVVCVTFTFLSLATGALAQPRSCGPFTLPGQRCTISVWQALGDAMQMWQEANQAYADDLHDRLEHARQRFFKAYPNGADFVGAEAEFEN